MRSSSVTSQGGRRNTRKYNIDDTKSSHLNHPPHLISAIFSSLIADFSSPVGSKPSDTSLMIVEVCFTNWPIKGVSLFCLPLLLSILKLLLSISTIFFKENFLLPMRQGFATMVYWLGVLITTNISWLWLAGAGLGSIVERARHTKNATGDKMREWSN